MGRFWEQTMAGASRRCEHGHGPSRSTGLSVGGPGLSLDYSVLPFRRSAVLDPSSTVSRSVAILPAASNLPVIAGFSGT